MVGWGCLPTAPSRFNGLIDAVSCRQGHSGHNSLIPARDFSTGFQTPMPAHLSTSPSNHPEHPAPKKYVLVVSCVDSRLLDDLVYFLDNDNLMNRYYQVALAGTALGLTNEIEQDVTDPLHLEQFSRWRQTFIEHVQATVLLTGGRISDIYIVQHEDCGAFRLFLNKDSSDMSAMEEQELHHRFAHALLQDIAENFFEVYNPADPVTKKPMQSKAPYVHTFYMDLRGHVKHLQSCTHVHAKPARKGRKKLG
jgi:hypothetical protein